MKPLSRLELIALVPALAAIKRDAALQALDSHIVKGRVQVNEDGSFAVGQLDGLYRLDPERAPKDDAAKAALLAKAIEVLDAEIEPLQQKLAALLQDRDVLRARRAEFLPVVKEAPVPPERGSRRT